MPRQVSLLPEIPELNPEIPCRGVTLVQASPGERRLASAA